MACPAKQTSRILSDGSARPMLQYLPNHIDDHLLFFFFSSITSFASHRTGETWTTVNARLPPSLPICHL